MRYLLMMVFSCLPWLVAQANLVESLVAEPKVVSAEQAFGLQVTVTEPDHLQLNWDIAPNTYLYRTKLKFELLAPNPQHHFELTPIHWPPAQTIEDPYFGPQEIYQNFLSLSLKIEQRVPDIEPILQVSYQGCSQMGLCYPLQQQSFKLKIQDQHLSQVLPYTPPNLAPLTPEPSPLTLSHTQQLFQDQSFFWQGLGFFIIGLLLSFTPCVLPMVPILAALIVGQKSLNARQSLFLASTYTLGMALTYAAMGALAAQFGHYLPALVQLPWLIGLFALLLVLLGLALNRGAHFALPSKILKPLHALNQRQTGGTYANAFIMGSLATLMASPCVSAPLLGIIGFIAHTGDLWVGAHALLMIGMGMGTPLIIAATLGGHLLPRAGAWMHQINALFAAMLFGLAIWLLERHWYSPWTLSLWAALAIYVAWKWGTFRSSTHWLMALCGSGILWYGALLLGYAGLGYANPGLPFKKLFQPAAVSTSTPNMHTITALEDLMPYLEKATQPLLIDFYADWCTSCRKIATYWQDPALAPALANWTLVKVDLSANQAPARALLKHFDLYGPPALIFMHQGQELLAARLVGDYSLATLKQRLADYEAIHLETQ
jgi:thiol:disulfide interchange protein DsbD